ncbi:MAG: hypothetical protein WDN28_01285 [Chthoniobacter sp.]
MADDDLQAVAGDSLTAKEIPWTVLGLIDCREDQPLSPSPTLQERAEGLQMLAWFPRNEPALKMVARLQAKVAALTPGADQDAVLRAARQYLARVDAPKPTRDELARICLERIANGVAANQAMTENMAWCLLPVPTLTRGSDFFLMAALQQPQRWRGIIGPAVALLKRNEAGVPSNAAAAVLETGWILDSLVKDEEIESWITSSSERLSLIGIQALARRLRWARLVELGWTLPAPRQLVVLKALAYAGRQDFDFEYQLLLGKGRPPLEVRRPDFANGEAKFWDHCARSMPVETANALWSYDFVDGQIPFDRIIHDPLRDFFKAEAARSEAEHDLDRGSSRLRTALRMLASWRMEEDDGVLIALLKHGGYERGETWRTEAPKHVLTKHFVLREAAKEALLKRGRPLPVDLVIESEIPAADSNPPVRGGERKQALFGLPQAQKNAT